ncbi:MAG TPA: hypothetical protein VHO94_03075 [Oscillospiraceae bacterium]|nr:hypothetical protein [Oscillospiraceae bacterium]
MSSNQYYDERQLIERGKIMQQSFFLLVILIFINAFLYGVAKIIWTDYFESQMIILLIPACYCTIRMIWKDAYNNIGSKFNIGPISSGILGLIIIWSNSNQMSINNMGFLSKGQLTMNGASIILGSGLVLICIAHLVKILKDKVVSSDKDE